MRTRIGAGALAGLAAGVITASLMSVMGITGPQDDVIRVVTLVAHVVRSDSFVVGWLVQVIVGIVIGASFGVLVALWGLQTESVAGWGTLYAIAWWAVGWLVLMPVTLGLRPFAFVVVPSLRAVAIAGMLGSLGYGATLGGVFTLLVRSPSATAQREQLRRAA